MIIGMDVIIHDFGVEGLVGLDAAVFRLRQPEMGRWRGEVDSSCSISVWDPHRRVRMEPPCSSHVSFADSKSNLWRRQFSPSETGCHRQHATNCHTP